MQTMLPTHNSLLHYCLGTALCYMAVSLSVVPRIFYRHWQPLHSFGWTPCSLHHMWHHCRGETNTLRKFSSDT